MPQSAIGSNYITSAVNPIVGRPVFSLYSYRWSGLDPATGDPLGILNGKPSKDYSNLAVAPLDSLSYSGSAQPTSFGAIRNDFSWKNLSISFNISYKFGYYFRKFSYEGSLPSGWTLNGDYGKRWQKPGDEKITNVPSFVYPANIPRQSFYDNSSILVEKADNIRLEDIRFGYEFPKNKFHFWTFSNLQLYAYASNLGVIWERNKDHIDPYYNNAPKLGKNYSLGLSFSF
jgi:hypothetical protein